MYALELANVSRNFVSTLLGKAVFKKMFLPKYGNSHKALAFSYIVFNMYNVLDVEMATSFSMIKCLLSSARKASG
jgi:hypothetical protein